MTLTGKTIVAGVIGDPISHSRSPMLHGFWLNQYQIDGVLIPLHVTASHLESAIAALPKLGFAGFSVTIPHKETILPLMTEIDTAAQSIGAVNAVAIRPDGSLYGQNTDGFGFLENLKAETAWASAGKTAIVLGAGGAARGIVYALAQDGIDAIMIVNRTQSKADKLIEDIGDHVEAKLVCAGWPQLNSLFEGADLLVNTTSLGMSGQPSLDLPLDRLPKSAIVSDIVYVPLETDLLKRSASFGLKTCSGLGMLIHQARPAFKNWFGRDPEAVPALFDLLQKDIQSQP